MDNIVKIRNVGSVDYLDYNGDIPYLIPAGGELTVQNAPVHEWLGDPDLEDDGRNNYRTKERERLFARYGIYENVSRLESARPPLEVYTLSGERIMTIMDDPFEHAKRSALIVTSTGDVAAEIAAIEAKLAQLKAQSQSTLVQATDEVPLGPAPAPRAPKMPRQKTGDLADAVAAEIPTDTPDRAKVG